MFGKLLTTIILPLYLISSVFAKPIDFERQIWPILKGKCVECHRAPYEKDGRTRQPKGELRLDAAWAINSGGEGGTVVIPGDAQNSELLYRTTLPKDDDDFMPPTGKADPLTNEEQKLLSDWINQGANFGDWTGNLKGKPKIDRKIPIFETQELYKKLSKDLTPVSKSTWVAVQQAHGRVSQLSSKSPLLEVDFRLAAETVSDPHIQSIRSIADHIVHLNVSKTQITDQSMIEIAKLKRLVRLDLHHTNISDTNIEQLNKLKHLRYLNLYGTQVSNKGLQALHSMKSLKAVYLWDSKATSKGAKALAEAIPDLKVNFK